MKSFNLKKTYKEYELDLLGVEGHHKQTISSYRFWYEHIKKNLFFIFFKDNRWENKSL